MSPLKPKHIIWTIFRVTLKFFHASRQEEAEAEYMWTFASGRLLVSDKACFGDDMRWWNITWRGSCCKRLQCGNTFMCQVQWGLTARVHKVSSNIVFMLVCNRESLAFLGSLSFISTLHPLFYVCLCVECVFFCSSLRPCDCVIKRQEIGHLAIVFPFLTPLSLRLVPQPPHSYIKSCWPGQRLSAHQIVTLHVLACWPGSDAPGLYKAVSKGCAHLCVYAQICLWIGLDMCVGAW